MDFRILGPLEVRRDGGLVHLSGPKQRALLADLLLHRNEVVSRDRLAEDVWGGRPPPNAKQLIWVHVSRLRKALATDALERHPPGYVLRVEPDELDLAQFERLTEEARASEPSLAAARLREALALWRGPPLADLRYEGFATAEIARLEELRLVALEARIDADLGLGRHTDVVAELEGLVAEYSGRERLRSLHMLALYRSGRQAEALDSYQDGRRALVEELGLEPSPELQRLQRAILAQEPSLEARAEPAAQPAATPGAILAAAREDQRVTHLLTLAAALASSEPRHELIVARVLAPSGRGGLADEVTRLEQQAAAGAHGATVRVAAFTSADAAADIARLAARHDVALLLLEAPMASLARELHRGELAKVLAGAPATSPSAPARPTPTGTARSWCPSARAITTGRPSSWVPGSPAQATRPSWSSAASRNATAAGATRAVSSPMPRSSSSGRRGSSPSRF
jgi:DNA-binding SARP family transcriptional activator